jgi:1-acyl-sn-glycerol-3-phosphate acyltransferase
VSYLRIVIVILIILVMTAIMAVPHIIGILLGSRISAWIPVYWHRIALRLLRMKIRMVGEPVKGEPALFVSNHVSWLDIVTVGATLPASFVAKHEVGTWPGIKYLANLQRTIYVSRDRHTAEKERAAMLKRVERGDSLILFPEGTSYDGMRIGEFRSAFFSLANLDPNGKPLKVQPFSITYTKVDGFPVSRRAMDKVAWYGDMDLAPHLLDYLLGGPYECTLRFFEPVTAAEIGNRKALARYCRDQIVRGNSEALSGSFHPIPKA